MVKLEIRNIKGCCICDVSGSIAEKLISYTLTNGHGIMGERKCIGKSKFKCIDITDDVTLNLGEVIIYLFKGSYMKILN